MPTQELNIILGSIIGFLVLIIIIIIFTVKRKKEKISLGTYQDNKKKIKNFDSEIISKKAEIQTLMKNIALLDTENNEIKTKMLEAFNSNDNQDIKEIVDKYTEENKKYTKEKIQNQKKEVPPMTTNPSKHQETKDTINKDTINKTQTEKKKDFQNNDSFIEKIQKESSSIQKEPSPIQKESSPKNLRQPK